MSHQTMNKETLASRPANGCIECRHQLEDICIHPSEPDDHDVSIWVAAGAQPGSPQVVPDWCPLKLRVEQEESTMSDTPPSRPAWCLEKAREWLQTHGLWWVSAGKEELLANLLDDAYLRGLHEERRRAGMAQLQTWTCVDCGETHPINHAGRFTAEGMSCCESDRSRPEGVSGGSTGAELEAATELETELDATRSELEGIKEPFCQLMKRLRVVDGAEDVESPYTRVLARVTLRLWNQLRNAYEATLPPVDHSWLDEVNKEEDKEEGAD